MSFRIKFGDNNIPDYQGVFTLELTALAMRVHVCVEYWIQQEQFPDATSHDWPLIPDPMLLKMSSDVMTAIGFMIVVSVKQ